jgi:glycosyltransferase involved in cell wall biosynthesis
MIDNLYSIPKVAIIAILSGRSGISRTVSTIVHYFLSKVTVIALGKSLYQNYYEEFPNSTKVVIIPFSSKLPRLISLWMTSILRDINVLNPHYPGGAILSAFVKLLTLGKCKNVWLVYDREEVNLIARKSRRKFIFRVLLRINAIDVILVLDNSVKAYVKKVLKTDKIVTVRVGIHPNMVKNYYILNENDKPNRFLISRQAINIFFHGILIPRRRLEDLILALAKVKEKIPRQIVLYISGSLKTDPAYVSYIRELVEKVKLSENVTFLGEINDFELSMMYKCVDIFVWPCDEQTWGLAPLEAMFFGKPTIVSKGSGVSEVLNEEVAILVQPRNPQALADALIRLIEDNRLREFLGKKAHEYVANNFTYKNTGKSLEVVFYKILE